MRSWYERYGVLIALAIFILISIVSFAGFSQTQQLLKLMCSPGDKGDCFRQWVSATSGWFGGAITLATLIVIWRQMNDVRSHHLETMLQAKRPTYLRAKRVKDATNLVRITLGLLAQAVREADENGATPEGFYSILAGVRSLRDDLSRPEFDAFESDIGYIGIGTAYGIRLGLQSVADWGNSIHEMLKLDSKQLDNAWFQDFKKRASYQEYTEAYLEGIVAAANRHIQDWSATSQAVD
jgi:hypothetical protein